MSGPRCPKCGADDMQPKEIANGMCSDCWWHEGEKQVLRDRIAALESENAKLLAVRDVERYVQAPPHESVMIVYESADAMGGDAAIARRTV